MGEEVRWRGIIVMVPTARGWALIALAGLGWLVSYYTALRLPYQLALLIGALMIIDAVHLGLTALMARFFSAASRLSADESVHRGQSCTLRVMGDLSVPSWIPLEVDIVEGSHHQESAHPLTYRLPLPAACATHEPTTWPSRQLSATVTPPERGWYEWTVRAVVLTGAFALWHAHVPARARTCTLVYPALIELPDLLVNWPSAAGRTGRWQADRGAELSDIRPYRPGDPIGHIHWKQSARLGELLVNEHREGRQAYCIALDTQPDSYSGPQEFEQAVSAAATLVQRWERRGIDVECCTWSVGDSEPGQIAQGYREVARMLACLRYGQATRALAGTPALVVTGSCAPHDGLPQVRVQDQELTVVSARPAVPSPRAAAAESVNAR